VDFRLRANDIMWPYYRERKMENETKQTRCPKCGRDNPEDTRFCNSCGCALPNMALNVKISKLAIVALVCALCGLLLITPGLVAVRFPRVLSPRLEWVALTFYADLIVLAVSLILGLVALIRVERSGGRITGRAYAVGAILIPVFAGLISVWFVIVNVPRCTAFRMVCGANLSGIGKAMLLYANDYDDALPSAVGSKGQWVARLPWWAAESRENAYGLSDADAVDGRASVSASLYLLVKYSDAKLKSFVCKYDYGTTEFIPASYGAGDRNPTDLWDFGPNPPRHCSYAYHFPYGPYALTTSSEPGSPVLADRNPWFDSPFARAGDFSKFDPDGDRKALRAGNTLAHKTDGQNVLFVDAHASFEKVPICGVNDDNIYTYWNRQDVRRGSRPKLGSQPADRLDSLLVNDPALPR